MKKLLLALLLLASPAFGQSVQEFPPVTHGHVPYWVTSGVIGDGGSSSDGPITSFGVTNNGGAGICVNSDRQSAAGRNQLCLGVQTSGAATISLQNHGTASPQALNFIVNGTTFPFPTGGSTFILGLGPFTGGDVPCFVDVTGTVQDCGHLGTIAAQNASAVAITGGTITGLPLPSNPNDAATKSYVDAVATGLNILAPSRLATAAVLPNTPAYANGSSGVGATLTAGSNTTLTVDGTVANLNDVILVNNQAAPAQNGIYTVTTAGDGSHAWVLTRATYFNTSAQMKAGSYTFITAGSVNASTSWTLQAAVPTVGTSAVTFVQFSSTATTVPGGSSGQVQFNNSGSFGGLTNTQLTADINTFTSSLSGAVPASSGGTTNFLRADGSFAAPSGAVTSVFTRSGAVVSANGDYNTGQITYTPTGTGAVATTSKAEFDRFIWANDYGAVCDGVTDDHTAFQNAINQGQTAGRPVRFHGSCALSTALSITSTIDFAADSKESGLFPAATIDAIDVVVGTNGLPVYLHDFTIAYGSTPSAGTQGISIGGSSTNINTGSHLWNIEIDNALVGVNFKQAAYWNVNNMVIAATGVTGSGCFSIANPAVGDAGDNSISATICQPGSGGVGIFYQSSGGLRIINNKILGSGMAEAIGLSLANGAVTGDLIIMGNSMEGFGTNAVGVSMARQGATGAFGNIIIANNQIGAPHFCVLHPTDANGTWTNEITVTGNICQLSAEASGTAVNIDSAQGIVVTNNNFISGVASDTPVQIGAGVSSATGCVVGLNARIGTWAGSSINSCQGYVPE